VSVDLDFVPEMKKPGVTFLLIVIIDNSAMPLRISVAGWL
jgi:hypothetical protein